MTVVQALAAGGVAEVARAVAEQTRPADSIGRLGDPPAAADWVWILDGTAVPEPDALAALVDAAERLEPLAPAALLTSRIVDEHGRLARSHVPIAPQGDSGLAVRAAPSRVLPVRAATAGSLLVRPARLPRSPRPGVVAATGWTATALRGAGQGFLVPASVARARTPGPLDATLRGARLLAGPGLRPAERLRLVADIVEQAIADRF